MHECQSSSPMGRVVGLWRYPVKSMAAEALAEVDVSWHGLCGDRRWAFIRNDAMGSGFPWLTVRECAKMGHYRPSFVNAAQPDKSPLLVYAQSGGVFKVTDPALAAHLWPNGAQAIKQARGIFDTFPVSVITTQTIARLSELVGCPLDVQRFRPNILVEGTGHAPFLEDNWVGNILRIGGSRVRIDKRDGRCVVITIDPATTERDPAILRRVARDRQGCLGVYGSTVEPGRVTLKDTVFLEGPA